MIRNFLSTGCWAVILALGMPAVGAQPGSIDSTFNPRTGIDQSVFAAATQSDGRVVIGGDFTLVNGVSRTGIARLDAGGTVDEGFDPGTGADDLVSAIAIQGDKAIIAGYFTTINDIPQGSIARLDSSGHLDSSFNTGNGADGPILAVVVQSDGKVLLGGQFSNFDGMPRSNIARLNSDGTLDSTFNPGAGIVTEAFSTVNALALQTDGKVIIGGVFTNVAGMPRRHIARLNDNGSLDGAFAPAVDLTGAGILAGINTLALDSSGRIVIGGDFTGVNAMARTNIARLNSNGSLDMTFNPGTGTDLAVNSVSVQSNDKVVLGGFFTRINGASRNYVARLNTSGSVDTGFDPGSGANDAVYFSAVQPDGKVLIGGLFTSFNGTPRDGIARLEGDPVVLSPRLFDPVHTGNTFRVSVATVPGRNYALEYKNDLTDPSWTSLTPVPGDGTIKILQDPGTTVPHRLYRVQSN